MTSAKTHVQTAREFHDLNMGFCCLNTAFDQSKTASNSYVHRFLCKNICENKAKDCIYVLHNKDLHNSFAESLDVTKALTYL